MAPSPSSKGCCKLAARKRPRERTAGGKKAKPTILIVCEGETELLYFKAIKSKFKARWIEVKQSDKPDPLGIVDCAYRIEKELKSKGLEVETWVVLDAESKADEVKRKYRDALSKARGRHFNLANSSPCFEYWPLLHFTPGIIVTDPEQASRELSKPERINGYKKPKLPFDLLWEKYETRRPSAAAAKRRECLLELGEDPVFGRPVTFVDTLVDSLCEINAR